MKPLRLVTFLLCLVVLKPPLADTARSAEEEIMGGPTSIGPELEYDDELPQIQLFEPWFTFKEDLYDRTGFDISLDYTVLFQQAETSLTGKDKALGNNFRVFGKWELLGRGTRETGSLVWKVENRGSLGTYDEPGSLGTHIGYSGATGMGFTDEGWFLAPLYWEQLFCDGNFGVVAGRLDTFDFLDVSGYANLRRRFQNRALLYNPTIPYPQVGLGLGAGFTMNDQWVVGATLHDANGERTKIDFLIDGSEFFKQAFVGWSPSRKQRFDKEVRLTAWDMDERSGRGIDDGRGLALSANWLFVERWMPFMRAGWADGEAGRSDKSFTVGILYRPENKIGELGAAWGWESPSDGALGNQQAAEVFFRWDVLPNFAVTPSVQLLIDPALNPSHDTVFVGGFRARVNF